MEQTRNTLLAIASEVCGTSVDGAADLVAAGFDSITMIEVANRVGEQLGVPCTADDVFESPSLDELARVLARRIDAIGLR